MRVFLQRPDYLDDLAIRVAALVATHAILLPFGVKLDCEAPRG